ncbi:MAG: crotonase/enoyl-CoA hydratase family protein [Myxococcota bacterium]
MADTSLRLTIDDSVAQIHADDGKANALSPAMIEALHGALDRAEKEAGAVLLVGRAGRFCAGFDLAVMRQGPSAMRDLVTSGAELFLRQLEFPLPIVAACTGHALAAGALLLLASDLRIGARGDFKIGLNEVGIGMSLPVFAVEMARQRLSKRHFLRATSQAELYDPEAAVDAGYLDRAVDAGDLEAAARAEARRLAEAPQPAFRLTKRSVHRALVQSVRNTLEEDMARLTGPTGAR